METDSTELPSFLPLSLLFFLIHVLVHEKRAILCYEADRAPLHASPFRREASKSRPFFANASTMAGKRKKKKRDKTGGESIVIRGNDDRLGIGSARSTLLT